MSFEIWIRDLSQKLDQRSALELGLEMRWPRAEGADA